MVFSQLRTRTRVPSARSFQHGKQSKVLLFRCAPLFWPPRPFHLGWLGGKTSWKLNTHRTDHSSWHGWFNDSTQVLYGRIPSATWSAALRSLWAKRALDPLFQARPAVFPIESTRCVGWGHIPWPLLQVSNIVAGCPANLPSTEQAVEAGCPSLVCNIAAWVPVEDGLYDVFLVSNLHRGSLTSQLLCLLFWEFDLNGRPNVWTCSLRGEKALKAFG